MAKHRHARQTRDVVKIDTPLMQLPIKGTVAIINPAYERFIDALAELIVKDLLARPPAQEGDRKARARRSPKSVYQLQAKYDVLTVDEAVQRLGVSRAELIAAFDKAQGVPIEVELK